LPKLCSNEKGSSFFGLTVYRYMHYAGNSRQRLVIDISLSFHSPMEATGVIIVLFVPFPGWMATVSVLRLVVSVFILLYSWLLGCCKVGMLIFDKIFLESIISIPKNSIESRHVVVKIKVYFYQELVDVSTTVTFM